jgi:hypothetical protein
MIPNELLEFEVTKYQRVLPLKTGAVSRQALARKGF